MALDEIKLEILQFIKKNTTKSKRFISKDDLIQELGVSNRELIEKALFELTEERMIRVEQSFGGIQLLKEYVNSSV